MAHTAQDVEKEIREANRLGLDYRQPPARRLNVPIIDFHTHIYPGPHLPAFLEAADLYGIESFYSMTPLSDAAALRSKMGDRVRFIAIPNWRRQEMEGLSPDFRRAWLADIGEFAALGSRLCKFWMAPPIRERVGLTLKHEFLAPVIDHALELNFEFLVHVADPSVWWRPGARYSNVAVFGTKAEQYDPFEWFLERVAPRRVVGVHMAGTVEDTVFLQGLLERHPNLLLDTSATKWIARETARTPKPVGELITRNARRILFGSDLVVAERFVTFDHYASRYWTHQMMWETGYRGECPIADPDADGAPQLAGVNLADEVLKLIYRENVRREFVSS